MAIWCDLQIFSFDIGMFTIFYRFQKNENHKLHTTSFFFNENSWLTNYREGWIRYPVPHTMPFNLQELSMTTPHAPEHHDQRNHNSKDISRNKLHPRR